MTLSFLLFSLPIFCSTDFFVGQKFATIKISVGPTYPTHKGYALREDWVSSDGGDIFVLSLATVVGERLYLRCSGCSLLIVAAEARRNGRTD